MTIVACQTAIKHDIHLRCSKSGSPKGLLSISSINDRIEVAQYSFTDISAKARPFKIGSAKMGSAKIGSAKIEFAKTGSAAIWSPEILSSPMKNMKCRLAKEEFSVVHETETHNRLAKAQGLEASKQMSKSGPVKENIVRIPKIIEVEQIVAMPEIEYKEILVERIVEVPEYRNETLSKEIVINDIIEVPVYQEKLVEVPVDHERYIPQPLELRSAWEFQVPTLVSQLVTKKIPYYIPRFIEVPISSASCSPEEFKEAQLIYDFCVQTLRDAPSLASLEELTSKAASATKLLSSNEDKWQNNILSNFKRNASLNSNKTA